MNLDKTFITEEHGKRLPTVRIKKAVLDNFKSVGHGEILFNDGKPFPPYGTESDILGLYGQNGSGKTSFIGALEILKTLMSGETLAPEYANCIAIDKEFAKLEFVFDLQYPDDKTHREATYSFCLKKREATADEIKEKDKGLSECELIFIPEKENRVVVFNEIFSLKWEDGKKTQPIIDTSKSTPFGPKPKLTLLSGNVKNRVFLEANRQQAIKECKSFVFMPDVLSIFKNSNEDRVIDKSQKSINNQKKKSVFYEVLCELRFFSLFYLFVISPKTLGRIRLGSDLESELLLPSGPIPIFSHKAFLLPEKVFPFYNNFIEKTSLVLEQLVPGLTIEVKKVSETRTEDGEPGYYAMVVSKRGNIKMPLYYESDGIVRIISILYLIIYAFNGKSVTLAIDEFDAGVFEYLLGEILKAMEEYGKGQFIFTSHNLRPLEVISKKFICFTTTDPQKRYVRIRNIANTNNLRDMYFREILLGEQEISLYESTKRYKIVEAFKNAWRDNNND